MALPVQPEDLEPADLEGLRRPERLLELFNQLQASAAAALNGGPKEGLTLANLRHVLLEDKECITPSDWTPLTLASGWASFGGSYGAPGVRKAPGGRVELREGVARAAGPPAVLASIATLPAWAWPQADVRRTGESSLNAIAGYQVTTGGDVQWLFGNPTLAFTFNGGSWQAADPSLPPWPAPLKVRVEERYTLRRVYVEARRTDASESELPGPVLVSGAYIEAPASAGDKPTLVVPRIDGLRENARYTLTILLLVE